MTKLERDFQLILAYFPESLQPHMLDPTISDLMVVGDKAYVDRGGKLQEIEVDIDPDGLDSGIENIARRLGNDFGPMNPILDSKLPDGSRVNAVHRSCSASGTTLTIRRFARHFTVVELITSGSLPQSVAEYVIAAIHAHKNGIVSGSTSSGKTTVLGALLDHIPQNERLVVIEKPAELKLDNRLLAPVRWEARDAVEGLPAVTTAQFLVAALRSRPDRIIVGEVRDAAAYDMLQAMNTGHSGTLSTIHADNAVNALERISELALSAYPNLRQDFTRRQTARAINFVMHCARVAGGKRKVTELIEVEEYDNKTDTFKTKHIYKEECN